jgi:hypothetical protein
MKIEVERELQAEEDAKRLKVVIKGKDEAT